MANRGEAMAFNQDEHEWLAPELTELIKLERGKFWFRVVNFCLYMHDYDPYAIFKPRKDKPRQAFDTSPDPWVSNSGLQMKHTSGDVFRHHVTLPVRVFAVYNLIKTIMISLAQHTLMRYEHLVPKYRHSRPLMSRETAHSIASHLGMPYCELKDLGLVFISTASCFFFVCTVALPLYHRRHPMDTGQLRFLLEPGRELERVDTSVRRRLVAISTSLKVYRNSKLANYWQRHLSRELPKQRICRRQWHGRPDELWLNHMAHRELHYCHKIEEYLGTQFCESKSFRPSTFAPHAYTKLVIRARLLVLGTLATYSACAILVVSCLIYSALSSKCPRLDCNPIRVFTWPELLVILETVAYIVITVASSLLNTTLFEMLTLCQLDLIGAVKTELADCHRAIVDFINSNGGSRDTLERLMLNSIVRLLIYERELKDNARCISEQTVLPACYLASAVLLAAINVQFKSPASGFLRWFIVLLLWLTVNRTAVSCANIRARVLSFQRQLWSVLAASSRLLTTEDDYYYHCDSSSSQEGDRQRLAPLSRHRFEWRPQPSLRCNGMCCSFVTDLWRKFVMSTSSNVEQHCSRLLNIKLSYQTIIEANFFSIFIYSLTLGHDK